MLFFCWLLLGDLRGGGRFDKRLCTYKNLSGLHCSDCLQWPAGRGAALQPPFAFPADLIPVLGPDGGRGQAAPGGHGPPSPKLPKGRWRGQTGPQQRWCHEEALGGWAGVAQQLPALPAPVPGCPVPIAWHRSSPGTPHPCHAKLRASCILSSQTSVKGKTLVGRAGIICPPEKPPGSGTPESAGSQLAHACPASGEKPRGLPASLGSSLAPSSAQAGLHAGWEMSQGRYILSV